MKKNIRKSSPSPGAELSFAMMMKPGFHPEILNYDGLRFYQGHLHYLLIKCNLQYPAKIIDRDFVSLIRNKEIEPHEMMIAIQQFSDFFRDHIPHVDAREREWDLRDRVIELLYYLKKEVQLIVFTY